MEHTHTHEPKRLYRSKTDRMIAGVCGGLATYFNIDSTILRLVWTLIVIFSGIFPGLVMYILAVIIIPTEPASVVKNS